MPEVPEVGAFLLGAPKCGTTWLAEVLTQHPEICVLTLRSRILSLATKEPLDEMNQSPIGENMRIASMGMVCELIVRFMQWLVLLLLRV